LLFEALAAYFGGESSHQLNLLESEMRPSTIGITTISCDALTKNESCGRMKN